MRKQGFHYRTIKVKPQRVAREQLSFVMDDSKEVVLSVPQYRGDLSRPVVKVGDRVKKGQLVAKGEGSMPLYASVSGIITDVVEYDDGITEIVVESDNRGRLAETLEKPLIKDRQDFINQVRRSGVMNSFTPLYRIFSGKDFRGMFLIAMQHEPFATSAYRTLVEDMDDILLACRTAVQFMNLKNIIIVMENRDYDIAEEMMDKARDYDLYGKFSIRMIPGKYVQRDRDIFTYEVTGRDPAILRTFAILRVSTMAELGSFLRTGQPCLSKKITVAGSAVKTACNVKVPVGARIMDVMEFLGGYASPPRKIVIGGPIQGYTVDTDRDPVTKDADIIMAFTGRDSTPPKARECIRCGTCRRGCPMKLSPSSIENAYNRENIKALLRLRAIDCIQCGNCTYICPAKRPVGEACRKSIELLKETAEDGKGI